MTRGTSVHGRGSGYNPEVPQDISETGRNDSQWYPTGGRHRALGSYRMGPGPVNHLQVFLGAPPGHKPTLIERGTGFHSDYPLTAHPGNDMLVAHRG
jgi:hypothetical protein